MPSRAPARLVAMLAAAELPLVILIAPALLFPSPTRVLAALAVPLIWLCHQRVSGHRIPPTPINAALLLLLGMVGVSLWATFDVSFSTGKVAGVLLGVFVFWASVRWLTTPARLAVGMGAFVLAGAVLAAVGLLGTRWIAKFPAFDAVLSLLPRAIRGLPGAEEGFQPNGVAGCLVLFVPAQVALLVAGAYRSLAPAIRNRWAGPCLVFIQVLLLILTAGTLVLTQSRGAFVGMAVAVGAFCLWYNRWTRLLAAAGTAAIFVMGIALGPERLFNLAISQSGPGMAGNVSGRLELWSRALYGIQDFAFTGMGMNTFRRILPVLYPTFLTPPDVDVAHAHNHLLQAALDLGLPGLIAYVAIWLTVASLLVMVYRRSAERVYRALAGGLGAGLIAHFTFGMTDAIALGAKAGLSFWLTLTLAVALHRVATTPLSRNGIPSPRERDLDSRKEIPSPPERGRGLG